MMGRKKVDGHNRTQLLKLFLDRKISKPVQETIVEPFWDCPEEEKEQLAKGILNLIQDCETEEEMLQNLRMLSLSPSQVVKGYYKTQILEKFSEWGVSVFARSRISKAIGGCEKSDREQKAKLILELTADCKTEEEVLQKLKDIIK